MHLRKDCKFRQAVCRSCGRSGHIQRVCRSNSNSTTAKVKVINSPQSPQPEADSEYDVSVFTLNHPSHLYEDVIFESGSIKKFILDTGSPVSFLPLNTANDLGHRKLQPSKTKIQGVTGNSLNVLGQFTAFVRVKENSSKITFIVTDSGPLVLGLDALHALKLNLVFQTSSSVDMPNEIQALIGKCHQNTGGMQTTPADFDITGDPKFLKARPVPYGLRAAVENNLNELVQSGILKPVTSSQWATPIVTPLKANGQPRICGDYRITVNPQLRQTATVTPVVEDMFAGLQGNTYFSKIDLSNAFLQIPLHDHAKEITTINTNWGLFQYQFLPFGLHISPGLFQKAINEILQNLHGVRSYQDDLIVFGHTIDEHNQNLLQLLRALDKHNVQINMKKSQFAVTQMKYLGYVISGQGISPDISRIKALKDAPIPDSAEKLHSFLGFAQYYAKFVPNFAALAQPLYTALQEFDNTTSIAKDYNCLLNALIDGKTLQSYHFGAPTQLVVDASSYAIGAILEQNGRPVTCISRKLSKSEQNYSQVQKEALAIHWSVTRLHKFLFGTPFVILTDHKALEYLLHPTSSVGKTTSAMMQRWALNLSAYNYQIHHKPGSEIANADYLSRYAEHEQEDSDEVNLVNPFPISRNILREETKAFYGPVLAGLRRGWSTSAKRRFPKLYAQRENLQNQGDDVIQFNNKVLIPPTLREKLLQHLHLGHIGRDKMISLSRFLCWWPSINADIKNFANNCTNCKQKPRSHPTWTPWPVTYQPMQRIHADYCGPFLGQYFALIIEDSYSKFPEVFLTKGATAEFTKSALQKFFAREGISQVFVSDNGTPFTAELLQQWLKSIGCNQVFSPPRHPQSNGLAENFIRTLKLAIKAFAPTSLNSLHQAIDTFLLRYRTAAHATTGKPPALLFKGRNLRTINLDTAEVIFYRGNDNRPSQGFVLNKIGKRLLNIIDRDDSSVHKRHLDQVTFTPSKNPCVLSERIIERSHVESEPTYSNGTPSSSPLSSNIRPHAPHTPSSRMPGTQPTLENTPTGPPTPVLENLPTAAAPPMQVPDVPKSPDLDNSAATPVPLRRSQRVRKKPDRYKPFL